MKQTIDWESFLSDILDGLYAFDIKKTGSTVMFVKNQLNSLPHQYRESVNLKKALQLLIENHNFSVTESLNHPDRYILLLDIGVTYLISHEHFLRKCAALYVSLSEFNRELSPVSFNDRIKLVSKCSFVLVKAIENWKLLNETIGIKNIYVQYGFMASVAEWWKRELIREEELLNHNSFLGITYLNEWKELWDNDKIIFFKANKSNKYLYGTILTDMERLEGKEYFNYFKFTKDCEKYNSEFYQIISSNAKYWISDKEIPNSDLLPGLIKSRDEYNRYIKNIKDDNLLSGEESENLIKSLLKGK